VKIIAIVRRVEDPEIKIKVKADGSDIETDQMKYVINPFDEIGVEEALRVRDSTSGELVVACVGSSDSTHQIRTALAMGADRGLHVVANDRPDPNAQASALKKLIDQESPDLVILGKQCIDDDMGQLGGILADQLGWGQASFASKEESLEGEEEKKKTVALKIADGKAEVLCEVDHGLEALSLTLPAIITTELRLNVPRYASLPGIMKAKKKKIESFELASLVDDPSPTVKVVTMEAPEERQAGVTVPDVATLVDKLRNEAKVL